MKNLLLVLCLVVFCLQAEAALPATDQNLEAAIAYGKSYQGEKNDAVMLQPWVIAESFETNPYRDDGSGYRRKNAGGCRYKCGEC